MIGLLPVTPEPPKPAPVRCSDLLAVSYGGGTNSTAMLCGFRDRGIKPDLILFADTGAEMPHTYKAVEIMAAKVKEWWSMELQTVRSLTRGEFEGLEGECLRLKHGEELPLACANGEVISKRNVELSDRGDQKQ